jgi:hypothetical protein
MSTVQASGESATGSATVKAGEMRLEVVVVPVSDATTYESVKDLADALRRAAEAHGKHEERTGEADPNWPDWYALYMVREQDGGGLPE